MACFRPLAATQLLGGEIVIHKRLDKTTLRKTPAGLGRDIALPCGRCIGCRIDRATQWATRLLHESQLHEENCSLTLTYGNNPNYSTGPEDPVYQHQDMLIAGKSARELSTIAPEGLQGPKIAHVGNSRSNNKTGPVELSKEDHQKFIKRLRHHIGPVRYYMCGEYGDKLARPHYHYIVFGYNFPDRKYHKKSPAGTPLYTSETLDKIWGHGWALIGEVDYATCAYVASYVLKKITGPKAEEHYRRTDEAGNDYWLEPEFNCMSRRPGIAKEWWEQFHRDVTVADAVYRNETATKPPRYYDKLLELMDPALYLTIKETRVANALTKQEDNTPARLESKEAVLTAKQMTKKRNYEENGQ